MNNRDVSFDINCKNVGISPNGYNSITVTIEDCDKIDIIDLVKDILSIDEVVDNFDEEIILDKIGVDTVKKYFGLTEETEQ